MIVGLKFCILYTSIYICGNVPLRRSHTVLYKCILTMTNDFNHFDYMLDFKLHLWGNYMAVPSYRHNM